VVGKLGGMGVGRVRRVRPLVLRVIWKGGVDVVVLVHGAVRRGGRGGRIASQFGMVASSVVLDVGGVVELAYGAAGRGGGGGRTAFQSAANDSSSAVVLLYGAVPFEGLGGERSQFASMASSSPLLVSASGVPVAVGNGRVIGGGRMIPVCISVAFGTSIICIVSSSPDILASAGKGGITMVAVFPSPAAAYIPSNHSSTASSNNTSRKPPL